MSKDTWYIEDCETQAVEQLSQPEILRRWLRGSLPDETRCWREGMRKWVPLVEAEPLATAMLRLKQSPSLIHFYCDCGNQISMGRNFARRKVKCKQCGTVLHVPASTDEKVLVTRQKVMEKIAEYLRQELTLERLTDWAQGQVIEGEFESQVVRDCVSRLGLSDTCTLGFAWEECQSLLRNLGYIAHVNIVEDQALRQSSSLKTG